jgi:GNAT superfamily N-acetyltransferase
LTVEVRPASDAEAAVCRATLPETFPAVGPAPECYVAIAPGAGVVGAAAVAWIPRGFPVLVRVSSGWRRQGIGRALLRSAIADAGGETSALRSWNTLPEGGDEADFLLACGFRILRRLLMFETDAVEFERSMTALLSRLRMAGKLPRDMQLATLGETPPSELIALLAPQFATLPHDVAWRLTPDAPGAYDPALSLVLLMGRSTVGAMMCRRTADTVEVDVSVVAPALRHSWANVVLLEATARRCHAAGITRFRFCCEPHVRDTLNLARRSGARSLPAQVSLALPLG